MGRLFAIVLGICTMWSGIFGAVAVQAAEEFPAKPIVCLLPVDPGSDLDNLSRPLLQKASTILGQPIMVVNKPGAGGTLFYRELHDAKPNGYTIGAATAAIVINRLQGTLPFNYDDFTFLGTNYKMYGIIVGATKAKRPFKTIQEVISFAKAHPGEVSLTTAGVGTGIWVGAMAFLKGTGININVIPQAGGTGSVMAQVAGGHMDLAAVHLPSAKGQIDAGIVRFLAVMGDKRAPEYPNVPTLQEIGYDVIWESCGYMMAPPKMPKDIADKLTKVFEKVANESEHHKFLLSRFTTPWYLPADQIIPYLHGQRTIIREIMDKAGILKEK